MSCFSTLLFFSTPHVFLIESDSLWIAVDRDAHLRNTGKGMTCYSSRRRGEIRPFLCVVGRTLLISGDLNRRSLNGQGAVRYHTETQLSSYSCAITWNIFVCFVFILLSSKALVEGPYLGGRGIFSVVYTIIRVSVGYLQIVWGVIVASREKGIFMKY